MSQENVLTTIEKVLFLKSIDLFAQTAIEDLGRIAVLTADVHFKAGETIFRQGEIVDTVYFVVQGLVAVAREGEPSRRVGAKEAFDVVAALDQEPAAHMASAIEPVHALKLNAQDFHDMLSLDYELVRVVFRALCRMIRESQR